MERLSPVARCRAAPIEVKPVNGNSEDARLCMNHSAVVSVFGVELAVGDSLLPALGFRFHRCRLPVAYSDSWYCGFRWFYIFSTVNIYAKFDGG